MLHLDDTPIKRWTRGRTRVLPIARIWCYTAADQVFFDFTDTRAGHWPRDLLRGYRGHIVADAYGGHDALFAGSGGIATEVGCWAHARRPFHELLDRAPSARDQLELIQALYASTRSPTSSPRRCTAIRSPSGRACAPPKRQRCSPRSATRAEAIIATEPEQSELAEGARYLRNHWTALTRFVDDGRLPLDNNAAERQQRPDRRRAQELAVRRQRGWRHLGGDLLSVFQSCRLQQLDPIAYLTDIMPG